MALDPEGRAEERRVGAATGGAAAECRLVSGKNKKDQIDKPLLSFYTLSLLLNWIVLFCVDTISCGMSHVVLLLFVSSHASLLLCFSFISLPIFPYLHISSLCLAVEQ